MPPLDCINIQGTHTNTQHQYILSLEEMMRFTWFLRSPCDWESNVLTYLSSISPRLSILSTFHFSVSRESLFILGFSQTQYGNLIGKWILIDQSSKCWTIKWLRIWWINRFGSRVPSEFGWIEHRCFKNIGNKRADQKYHVSLSNSYKKSPHQELTYSGLFESPPGNELEFLLYFNFAIVSPQYPCS